MRSSRAPPLAMGQRARREAWRPTCAPSPTVAATRFTEPERTSPMAKTQALSCLQQATLLLRAGQHEAFRVHSDARSGQPGRIRLRSDEKKEVTQRPAHFVAGIGLPPADRLQHAVAAFETGVSGFPPRANAQSTIDQIDELAGEIARELEARRRQGLRSRCPSILRHPFALTAVGSITLGPGGARPFLSVDAARAAA